MNPTSSEQQIVNINPDQFKAWDDAMTRAFKGIRGRAQRHRDLRFYLKLAVAREAKEQS